MKVSELIRILDLKKDGVVNIAIPSVGIIRNVDLSLMSFWKPYSETTLLIDGGYVSDGDNDFGIQDIAPTWDEKHTMTKKEAILELEALMTRLAVHDDANVALDIAIETLKKAVETEDKGDKPHRDKSYTEEKKASKKGNTGLSEEERKFVEMMDRMIDLLPGVMR